MTLPFDSEQFHEIFATYNSAIGAAPAVAWLLGVAGVLYALRPGPVRSRVTAAILALLWFWDGVIYHGFYFLQINDAALLFAALFVAEGVLILHYGVLRGRLLFYYGNQSRHVAGALMLAFALLLYPLAGLASGQRYPALPLFGVAPCPTTIYTLGLLLWAMEDCPEPLWLLPLLWAVIGTSAAYLLEVPQDYALGISAIAAIFSLARNRARSSARRSGG
jgi:hypothetical protein